MTICYLGLGSNLANPVRQLRQAIGHLRALPKSSLLKISPIYKSKPFGGSTQPNYANLVLALKTHLPPLKLLVYCQAIERQQGRIRKKRWGARTLDIDILLYGNHRLEHPRLTLPHPRMQERDFVLIPLLVIAPTLHFPDGQSPERILNQCESHIIS